MDEPELREGSSGEWVTHLHGLLARWGHPLPQGADTATFGSDTAELVRAFQQAHPPLHADGVVSHYTWGVLTGEQHPARFELTLGDLPSLAQLHDVRDETTAEAHLAQLTGSHEGGTDDAQQASAGDVASQCESERRALGIALAALAAAAEEFGRNPGLGTGLALLIAIANCINAAYNYQECMDRNPQLPPGIIERIREWIEHLVADRDRLQAALPPNARA